MIAAFLSIRQLLLSIIFLQAFASLVTCNTEFGRAGVIDGVAHCPGYYYNVMIISIEPLIIYLPSFLTDQEVSHLLKLRSLLPSSFLMFR